MAWGSKTSGGTQKTNIGTTESFFDKVTLNPRETAHCEIIADNQSGSITDHLIVSVYATLDASSEDWDERPLFSYRHVPGAVTADKASFLVTGVYAFRVGVRSAGSTDQYTVDMNYRLDGVSL